MRMFRHSDIWDDMKLNNLKIGIVATLNFKQWREWQNDKV